MERIEIRTRKHPSARQENNLRGTDGATANEEPTKKPNDAPGGNGWTRGDRRTQQEAEQPSAGERMDRRTTTHPAGSRTTHLRGTDGAKDNEKPPWNGWSQGQRRTYVEKIDTRTEKNSLNDMFLSIFSGRMPNIALQRTPLARPRSWARSWGVVAPHHLSRFTEAASDAAESRRWAASCCHLLYVYLLESKSETH